MGEVPHKLLLLPNRTYQAVVRSDIKKLAHTVEFSSKKFAELEIIVAELTSNLVKHAAVGGEILVKVLSGDNPGLEIICIDHGPGMNSVQQMMEDGASTTRTLGQGLGAISRLSDEFDIYSQKGWGTITVSRLYRNKAGINKKPLNTGTVMVAKTGEVACGDNYLFVKKGNIQYIAICDGLGHGPAAAEAAALCLKIFLENIDLPPVQQLRAVHEAARKTRGAVMYVAQIDVTLRKMQYCGVGNIAARLLSPGGKTKTCSSYNGIVGHSLPATLHNYTVDFEKNDLLVLHSDGLNSRWDLQKYPGILKHDKVILAAALYKDNCRGTDDTLVTLIG